MATDSTSELKLIVDLWSWPETVGEIQRRMVAFGVRRKRIESRWRGLKVELSVEVEGTDAQLLGFARFIDSLGG